MARFAPVPTRLFWGLYSPLAGAILEGPLRAFSPIGNTRSRRGRGLPPLARRDLPFRPYLHARIPRITVAEQLPQTINPQLPKKRYAAA